MDRWIQLKKPVPIVKRYDRHLSAAAAPFVGER
jgi:hypothetical protein